MDNLLEKFKNRKYQKKFLIYLVVVIAIILLLNWLIKSGQAKRNENQAENFNLYYQQLLSQCGKEKEVYDCCLNSVAYMSANNLKTAGLGCEPGFKLNTFACLGSLKWCEMIR